MDKTNINALVQSIEHSLHLIYKNIFSIKQYQFHQNLALNLFKESRRTSPLSVSRRLWLYIYPRRPEVMVGRDREWRAYRHVCGQRGRNLTTTMAIHVLYLSNVFLGSCWSKEYCVGFSVTFWHGRGKNGSRQVGGLCVWRGASPPRFGHSRSIRTQLMLPPSTSLKRI